MFNITAQSATEAWDIWYDILSTQKLQQPSRDGIVVGEVINASTTILNPRWGLVQSDKRKLSVNYAVGELLWYLSGSNSLSDIQPYSSVWEKLSDDGMTINSAYGHRIHHKFGFDQWLHVKNLLTKDPYTRQAVIHIKEPSNVPTKDLPCTISLQYLIREGALHCIVYMRSNDLWLGFPYDVFCFTAFQTKLAMELGVKLGNYTHIAGSLHLYERNLVQDET